MKSDQPNLSGTHQNFLKSMNPILLNPTSPVNQSRMQSSRDLSGWLKEGEAAGSTIIFRKAGAVTGTGFIFSNQNN